MANLEHPRIVVVADARHPLIVGVYAGLLALAVFYLLDLTQATAMSEVTGGLELAWQVPLFIGSALALVGYCTPKRLRLRALITESIGAAILGGELGLYVWSLIDTSRTTPWATVLVFAGVALGSAVRAPQALMERGRIITGAAQVLTKEGDQ